MAATPQSAFAELFAAPEAEQRAAGYFHTLREIVQQPATWRETARQIAAEEARLRKLLEGVGVIVLTGSGSSEYVGECVAPFLRTRLKRTVEGIGGGDVVPLRRRCVTLRPSCPRGVDCQIGPEPGERCGRIRAARQRV